MGFGFHGKIADRFNRSLLKKRKLKSLDDVIGSDGPHKLNFKKSDLKEVLKIRREMRAHNRQQRILGFKIGVVLFIIFLLCYLIFN